MVKRLDKLVWGRIISQVNLIILRDLTQECRKIFDWHGYNRLKDALIYIIGL